MGQGHYNAIGFGCIETKQLAELLNSEDESGDDFIDLAGDLGVQSGYESEPGYWAVLLCAGGDMDSKPLPRTMPLEQFTASVGAMSFARAKAKWERFRRAAAKKGIELPEGRLLWIADYD